MSDNRPFGSSNWTLVVACVLLVPFLLWASGLIEFDDDATSPRVEPTAQPVPDATPEEMTAEPAAPGPAVTRSDPEAPTTDDAPPEVAASLARSDAGDLPSLGAIWSGDRLHLVGAVPGRAEADAVLSIAETLAGPDAVVDAMVLDERSDAPRSLAVRVDDAAAWAPNADALDPALRPIAEAVAAVLADDAARQVTVIGHLDDTGDPIAVLDTTRRRADAFARAIVDAGAPRDRVAAIGRGASRPLVDSDDPERNRRIDLVFEF